MNLKDNEILNIIKNTSGLIDCLTDPYDDGCDYGYKEANSIISDLIRFAKIIEYEVGIRYNNKVDSLHKDLYITSNNLHWYMREYENLKKQVVEQ